MATQPEMTQTRLLAPSELRRSMVASADNRTRDRVVAQTVQLALGPWTRLRGLIGRPPLGPDEGLLLRPCRGIHTFLMRYSIDVLFLDHHGRVVDLVRRIRPWRMTTIYRDALCALELPAGQIASSGTERGDQLLFRVFVE